MPKKTIEKMLENGHALYAMTTTAEGGNTVMGFSSQYRRDKWFEQFGNAMGARRLTREQMREAVGEATGPDGRPGRWVHFHGYGAQFVPNVGLTESRGASRSGQISAYVSDGDRERLLQLVTAGYAPSVTAALVRMIRETAMPATDVPADAGTF